MEYSSSNLEKKRGRMIQYEIENVNLLIFFLYQGKLQTISLISKIRKA